ncbi:MAG: NAD(P)(+) transhydrogenase (Re/Si-specific) subunit beta, partial [Deltaproteobacteria bacterium]|nr:NAD(P)(+) transhydrogenase (Re/Si-specific) subunit beta [Deltaproteobacteria bacterium]
MNLAELSYLIASILFIVGLKRLSSPATARSGNILAAVGMGAALGGTFLVGGMANIPLIIAAIVLGTLPGWQLARTVKMTSMPQMVSLFNGMGGACALLISLSEMLKINAGTYAGLPCIAAVMMSAPIVLGIIFGAISFTGSIVAFGKLQGLITEKPVRWPLQKTLNVVLLACILYYSYGVAHYGLVSVLDSENPRVLWMAGLAMLSLILGVAQVLPIGGADMPVVISVLNSCTGLAAALTGFSMNNMAMIIAGTLVGAAGSFLTLLMCNAMNRSLANVLFGSFGGGVAAGAAAGNAGEQVMKEVSTS